MSKLVLPHGSGPLKPLLLEGKDRFIKKAGEHGLLFERMDENGWPIDKRVGRHCSSILQIAELWTEENPERGLRITNIPRYLEIIEKGTGFYLHDPSKADTRRLLYE
jgi:hypothetical protein